MQYYLILQQNGPMILLGDEIVSNNEEAEYYARTRNTYDECVAYITNELVLAAQALPLDRAIQEIARPTRGAALALRAKVLLYAASPLMNGQTPADIASELVDDQGNRLLPEAYDESKWAKAAAAAKDVIELNRYTLFVSYATDKGILHFLQRLLLHTTLNSQNKLGRMGGKTSIRSNLIVLYSTEQSVLLRIKN